MSVSPYRTSVSDPCMGDETGGVAGLSEGGRVGGTGSPPRQRWMRYMAMANSLLVRAPSPSTSARVHIWKGGGGGGVEGGGRVRVRRGMKERRGRQEMERRDTEGARIERCRVDKGRIRKAGRH